MKKKDKMCLDQPPPPIVSPAPIVGYEGYSNVATFFAAYWFRNEPELEKRYKQVIRANAKIENRSAAMRILIQSKKELLISIAGVDFDEVNIDELIIDLSSDYPF